MTYTFKLARRLAVSRTLLLPAILLFVACTGDTTAPESSDPLGPQDDWRPRQAVPVTVSVNPGSVTVETNQLIRFLAYGRNSDGDSVFAPISWRASGGTILPDGRFSSAAVGEFMITGTTSTQGEEVVDTSVVKVVRRQLNLKSIRISPEAATLAPGVVQDFNVTGRLPNGSVVPIGAVWTATGGMIDAGGNYTPGDTAGTYQVIASNTALTLADTAIITITAPPLPPPPAPSPTDPPDPSPTDTTAPSPTEPPAPAPTEPPPPVAPALAQVTLVPASVTLAPSATRQFQAYGRTTDGDSIAVTVSFAATGGTVTAAGFFTAGSTAGSYRIIASAGTVADTSSITITTPLGSGPASSVCLARTGPLLTLSGASSTMYDTRTAPLAEGTRVDASTASWTGYSFPVYVAGKPGLCWTGGKIQGTLDETTPWTTWHSSSALYVSGENAVVENLRADNYGDGVRFTTPGTKNWTLRGVHFTKMHDDCVENDRLESGLVEDVLLNGCYVAFSARPGNSFQDLVNGSGKTVTVRNSLVRLRQQVSVYKGTSPGSGGFFKVENELIGINVSWVLENNIFRADGPSDWATLCLNQHGKFTARNNIMVWLGEGNYPCALPAGWQLTRDRAVWDNAVAEWKARHPNLPL